jgi:ABC-type multidrug transport system ATPase subunit
MIVIASFDQPSTNTLLQFDNILVLTEGRSVYFGPPTEAVRYFQNLGFTPPAIMCPAEFILDLTNMEFHRGDRDHLSTLLNGWEASSEKKMLRDEIAFSQRSNKVISLSDIQKRYPRIMPMQILILIRRTFVVYLLFFV